MTTKTTLSSANTMQLKSDTDKSESKDGKKRSGTQGLSNRRKSTEAASDKSNTDSRAAAQEDIVAPRKAQLTSEAAPVNNMVP